MGLGLDRFHSSIMQYMGYIDEMLPFPVIGICTVGVLSYRLLESID